MLLGFQPNEGRDLGLRPRADHLKAALRGDLDAEPFTEETLRLVEDLIVFLRQDQVAVRLYERGFLHAKCYLFYGGKGAQVTLFDRLLPLVGIVGSSNFTAPGLSTNHELNLAHKTLLDEEEVNDVEAHSSAQLDRHAATPDAVNVSSTSLAPAPAEVVIEH